MFSNNRHLNLFEHYTQPNALPIENNISRGLAIALRESPLFLDRFLDYINTAKNNTVKIQKHSHLDELIVDVQQSVNNIVNSFPNPKAVIGMTLTTVKNTSFEENTNYNKNNYITDIVVGCGDTLIVIEVKRNAIDAQLQLREQIESILSEINNLGETKPSTNYISASWDDIILILQQVSNLTKNTIIEHYLKHLEYKYPEWFPIQLLCDIEIKEENKNLIEKRLVRLTQNCCENNGDEKKYAGRYVVPKNHTFLSEAQIIVDYENKSIKVVVWPGDTKWQAHHLFSSPLLNLNWINKSKIQVDNHKLNLLVEPYLRFAHFQSSVFTPLINRKYYDENIGTNKKKCLDLWNDITKEWKRPVWDQLKDKLLVKYSGLVDDDIFIEGFTTYFEKSNRNYVHVSFGYQVTTFIPKHLLVSLETNNFTNKESDQLAKFINNVINSMIAQINNED